MCSVFPSCLKYRCVPKIASEATAKKTIGKQHVPCIFPNKRKKPNNNNNFSSGGRGALFPTIPCWVQPPVEKETQKPSFWEQVLGENILVYLKSPRRRREKKLTVEMHVACIFPIKRNILVYLKSPRRRREKILTVKQHVPCIFPIKRKK